jgi:hypothetical protein
VKNQRSLILVLFLAGSSASGQGTDTAGRLAFRDRVWDVTVKIARQAHDTSVTNVHPLWNDLTACGESILPEIGALVEEVHKRRRDYQAAKIIEVLWEAERRFGLTNASSQILSFLDDADTPSRPLHRSKEIAARYARERGVRMGEEFSSASAEASDGIPGPTAAGPPRHPDATDAAVTVAPPKQPAAIAGAKPDAPAPESPPVPLSCMRFAVLLAAGAGAAAALFSWRKRRENKKR